MSLFELWSKGLFFRVYWPLILGLFAFYGYWRISIGIVERATYERDAIQQARFAFAARSANTCLAVGIIAFIYHFDILQVLYEMYREGLEQVTG